MLQYPHKPGGGDAIGSGYLYRGKNIPALRGKYVFTDISTGRLWYVDYQEMLKADDGNADTMAAMHEIHLRWDDPNDTPDAGKKIYPTMFPIAMAAYHARGGKDPDLPGRATVSGTAAPTRILPSTPPASLHLQQDRRHDSRGGRTGSRDLDAARASGR